MPHKAGKAPPRPAASRTRQRSAGTSRKAKSPARVRFSATLHQPAAEPGSATGKDADWTFLILPATASRKLPSRGQTTVDGTLNGARFQATLEPDGQGSHWLKVDRRMQNAAAAHVGDVVTVEVEPVAIEPEPQVPEDLRWALAAAPAKTREAWLDITPAARRDFVHWINSAKQRETRARRVSNACDMLAKGKRRPCCFDRSGMYSKSMSCPLIERNSDSPRT